MDFIFSQDLGLEICPYGRCLGCRSNGSARVTACSQVMTFDGWVDHLLREMLDVNVDDWFRVSARGINVDLGDVRGGVHWAVDGETELPCWPGAFFSSLSEP